AKAVYFLWHFPADRSDWPLASTLPCEARTFLPSARPAPTGVRPSRSDKEGHITRRAPLATSLHPLVDGAVAHLVGRRIHLPGHVHQLHPGKTVEQLERLVVKRPQGGTLHLVASPELANQKLAVGEDLDLANAELAGSPQPEQKPHVLGVVVGANAEELAQPV